MPAITRRWSGLRRRETALAAQAGRAVSKDRGGRRSNPAVAMLNLPTLWTVFVVNFLSVGLIWAYVARSYPRLEATRFWMASAFTAAGGALLAMTILFVPGSLLPLLPPRTPPPNYIYHPLLST